MALYKLNQIPNFPPISKKKLAPILFLAILAAIEFIWAYWGGFSFGVKASSFLVIVILAGISIIYGHSGRSRKLSDMAYYGLLWIGLTICGVVMTYLMASLQHPLYDEKFIALDAALGFHWLDWYNWLHAHPVFRKILIISYTLLMLQVCLSILFFSHIGRTDRIDELWWTAIISLMATSIISGLFPAIGAFYHYGTGLEYADHLDHLLALRDANLKQVGIYEMKGIITFPSYHAALAVLFMYVFRGLGIWYIVSIIANILMLLSTPPFGGHYLVDVIAGCAIAALAIYIVKYSQRLLAKGGYMKAGLQTSVQTS